MVYRLLYKLDKSYDKMMRELLEREGKTTELQEA